ncbi:cilia- and flagella-associated protein 99-like [Corythoichthys intestinalis]|uniref:cilia- and flagella-associated protein 99-like n=1 Tax=Corythoichthys intestinalis TaxID=161448 RepID=UPI0025A5D69F|nr:cilia- and flagella-associated protein 99-like [Corythoichthys intestinalis]
MEESYGSLLKKASALIDQFAASKQTLDDFIEDASKNLKDMELQHREFVIVVVSGCIEQKKALDVIINPYLCHEGKTQKHFRSQFATMCYLTIFHFDDLGPAAYKTVVRSLNSENMLTFLMFFFSNLTTWIQNELNSIYDAQYLKDHWIDPLLRRRSEIMTLLRKLSVREPKTPSKTTKPVEFSFCNRKVPSRPQPAPSPLPEKYVPVPNSMYTLPKEVQTLHVLKQRNQQKGDELLDEANMSPFKCAKPQKSEQTKRAMAKIKEELDSKLKFNSIFKSPPVPMTKNTWPVKLNIATIMRQRALYNHQVEEELARMENLVEGAYEPSAFLQWQKAMRDKDHQEKTAIRDQRRATTLMNRFDVAIDRTKATECKKKAARLKKEESSQMKLKITQRRIQEEKKIRDKVRVLSGNFKTKPQKAREEVKKFKQSVVKQISKQNQKLYLQGREEEQAEVHKKMKAIREQNTIKSVPLIRLKFVDDTELAGHDLLEEMSCAEVKERLILMKEADIIEQQKKRNCILEEKHKKKQLLWEEMDNINLRSRVMGMAATFRKEEKRKAILKVQQTREETALVLQKKFEEKKQEYQKVMNFLRNKEAVENKAGGESQGQQTLLKTQFQKAGLKKINWEDLENNLQEYIERGDSQVVSQKKQLKKEMCPK